MDVWLVKFTKVLWDCFKLTLFSIYMRLWFLVDPSARKRDLEKVTEGYKFPEEGLKYIKWRNADTVSNFFYTWNMIYDHFVSMMQDINKV